MEKYQQNLVILDSLLHLDLQGLLVDIDSVVRDQLIDFGVDIFQTITHIEGNSAVGFFRCADGQKLDAWELADLELVLSKLPFLGVVYHELIVNEQLAI